MRNLFFSVAPLLVALGILFSPCLVSADGALMEPERDGWNYSLEKSQQAFINYENGLEKMILGIEMDENKKGLFWIFPVPAVPNKISIDIIDDFPDIDGTEISDKARYNLAAIIFFMSTHHFAFYYQGIIDILAGAGDSEYGTTMRNKNELGRNDDVKIYKHIDKEGVSSEIITARNADSLYNYLNNKGLTIQKGSVPVLNNYMGKNYSFIVSWINQEGATPASSKYKIITKKIKKTNEELLMNVPQEVVDRMINKLVQGLPDIQKYFLEHPRDVQGYVKDHPWAYSIVIEYLQSEPNFSFKEITEKKPILSKEHNYPQKGVSVTFPTQKIYFPLLPTSVYGSKNIPAVIRVIGYVTPQIFPDIKNYTEIKYYIGGMFRNPDRFKNLFDNQEKTFKYTKIKIDAPAKFFTDDLWIKTHTPFKTYYILLFSEHPFIAGVILFVLISVTMSLLIGLIVFKKLRKKPLKLILLGLANFLTIVGLTIFVLLTNTKEKDEEAEKIVDELRRKGYYWRSRVALILFVIISFFLLDLLLLYFLHFSRIDVDYYLYAGILSIALMSMVFLFKNITIKKEDKDLFKQLRSSDYSLWSFQPKDKMKIVFIILFPILFSLISYLLTLIEITF